ncbi:hypothetical protein WJX74_007058 [Apatococcus lobatus]|uniref:Ubiquitin-like domain-containing protein n=1 Tax=Apatococcus lobatus TaxID=904363 RepID=A0AAW1QI38_9CHLO
MQVAIRHGQKVHMVQAEPQDRIKALMSLAEQLTGVLVRKQKLVFKGKVLAEDKTLEEAKVKEGSTLMLIAAASQMTQGQEAAREAAIQNFQASQSRAAARTPTIAAAWQDRAKTWAKTGVVSVRDSGLTELPAEALSVSAPVRVLDASNNCLQQLPMAASSLAGQLIRLAASHNQLDHGQLPGLATFIHLKVLLLDHNRFQHNPAELASLTALEHLSLSNNKLETFGGQCLSNLGKLQRLELQNNALRTLPAECSNLISLQELNASCNQLQGLPDSMAALTCLRTLLLDTNRLQTVPKEVMAGCSNLTLLSLHNNPLTADQLRQAEGFAALDGRRQLRIGKQLDMRVLVASDGFTEGADPQDS